MKGHAWYSAIGLLGFSRKVGNAAPQPSMVAALLVLFTAVLEIAALIFLAPLLTMAGSGNTGGQSPLLHWLYPLIEFLSFNGLLIACVVTLGLLSTLSQFSAVLHRQIAYVFVGKLRRALLAALLSARWTFVAELKSADVTHALTTSTVYLVFAVQQVWQLLSGCVMIAVYAVICVIWSPQITVLAALGLILPLILGRLRRKSSTQLRGRHAEASLSFDSIVADSLVSVRWAKLHGTTAQVFDQVENTLETHADADLALTRHNSTNRVIQSAWGALMMGAMLYLTLVRMHLPLSQIVVLMFVLFRLWPRVGSLMTIYHQIDHALPFLDETLQLTQKIECAVEDNNVKKTNLRLTLKREIELKGISFQHGSGKSSLQQADSGNVIENINAVIAADSITALVGPSGTGKSTLLDLVVGLLEPQSGSVLVDGQELAPATLAAWRNSIACVGADSPLFHTSLRANLCIGGTVAAEKELWSALHIASATEFVQHLPERLDTDIGDRGSRLSSGERQRICIARAVLRNPELLILDEATGALDTETESRIFKRLQLWRGKRTILVVSHRDTVYEFADRVLELKEGQLVVTTLKR